MLSVNAKFIRDLVSNGGGAVTAVSVFFLQVFHKQQSALVSKRLRWASVFGLSSFKPEGFVYYENERTKY